MSQTKGENACFETSITFRSAGFLIGELSNMCYYNMNFCCHIEFMAKSDLTPQIPIFIQSFFYIIYSRKVIFIQSYLTFTVVKDETWKFALYNIVNFVMSISITKCFFSCSSLSGVCTMCQRRDSARYFYSSVLHERLKIVQLNPLQLFAKSEFEQIMYLNVAFTTYIFNFPPTVIKTNLLKLYFKIKKMYFFNLKKNPLNKIFVY